MLWLLAGLWYLVGKHCAAYSAIEDFHIIFEGLSQPPTQQNKLVADHFPFSQQRCAGSQNESTFLGAASCAWRVTGLAAHSWEVENCDNFINYW